MEKCLKCDGKIFACLTFKFALPPCALCERCFIELSETNLIETCPKVLDMKIKFIEEN